MAMYGDSCLGDAAGHVHVGEPTDVVDHLRPCGHGGSCHPCGSGPSRFTTDVDDVRSCRGKGQPVFDGTRAAETATAVRKGIWCHIDDSHDETTVSCRKPENLGSAVLAGLSQWNTTVRLPSSRIRFSVCQRTA